MDGDPQHYTTFFLLAAQLGTEIWFSIGVLIILLASSALVSGSEVAFFSLSPSDRNELEDNKNKSSETVKLLLSKPKELLAVILILNNFINIAIVILASYVFLNFYPETDEFDLLRSIIEIGVITFVILLIGEVVPKVYANRNSMKIALLMAKPIYYAGKLPPFSWLKIILVNGTDVILKTARKKSIDISTDDLEHAIALTREENSSEDEHKILEGIVNFGNTDVKQIMRSRVDTVAIEKNINFEELLEVIREAGYSRIPVYEEKFDDVLGIIYIKDLLPHLGEEANFDWRVLIRTPFFVPENKKIDDLLKEFQSMKMHMAVVVDEYGGASGIVTLEDVLEEIVGDITDEFDDDNIIYSKINENTFVFEGKTPLVDLYKVLDIDGKSFEQAKGESDSIAGFLIEQSGKILRNNESFEFENIKFIVESSDKKRVKTVKIIKLNHAEE
ncbi:MAG: gliding motility-associated protein GldE [Crocinitomicaceae bacterium]|nr:gliding motility-associated protein GldE [Crocinitomicaceae bacterium]